MGGIARRVRWIREHAGDRSRALLLEAGDFLFKYRMTPSERLLNRARLILDAYKEMGYTALAIGEKDLSGSIPFLVDELEKRGLTGLSANILFKGQAPFKPYVIREVSGLKVAIAAVTSPRTEDGSDARGDLHLLNPLEKMESLLPEMRKNADVVVVLSNLADSAEKVMLERMQGIDIVISSGSGRVLRKPGRMQGTYLLRAHSKGEGIGAADIRVEGSGKISSLENNLVVFTEDLPEDEAFVQKAGEFKGGPGNQAPKKTSADGKKSVNPFLQLTEQAKKRQQETAGDQPQDQKTEKSQEEAIKAFLEALEKARMRQQGTLQEEDAGSSPGEEAGAEQESTGSSKQDEKK